jgi:hypothetical protein
MAVAWHGVGLDCLTPGRRRVRRPIVTGGLELLV